MVTGKAVNEFLNLNFSSLPLDMFPWLEWMDLGGYVKAMKAVTKEMDSLMARLMEEKRDRRASAVATVDANFIYKKFLKGKN